MGGQLESFANKLVTVVTVVLIAASWVVIILLVLRDAMQRYEDQKWQIFLWVVLAGLFWILGGIAYFANVKLASRVFIQQPTRRPREGPERTPSLGASERKSPSTRTKPPHTGETPNPVHKKEPTAAPGAGLVIRRISGPGQIPDGSIWLKWGENILGRDPQSTSPGISHKITKDPTISRKHARIHIDQDTSSEGKTIRVVAMRTYDTNPYATWVCEKGTKKPIGPNQETSLEIGQHFKLGDTTLIITTEHSAELRFSASSKSHTPPPESHAEQPAEVSRYGSRLGLKVIQGPDTDLEYRTQGGQDSVKIGRQDDRDLILSDRRVSRRHAIAVRARGTNTWRLKDDRSTYGTFIVSENEDSETPDSRVTEMTLRSGQKIKLGETVIYVEVL